MTDTRPNEPEDLGQLLHEARVKLRDIQGKEAARDYACNLLKRIDRTLGSDA